MPRGTFQRDTPLLCTINHRTQSPQQRSSIAPLKAGYATSLHCTICHRQTGRQRDKARSKPDKRKQGIGFPIEEKLLTASWTSRVTWHGWKHDMTFTASRMNDTAASMSWLPSEWPDMAKLKSFNFGQMFLVVRGIIRFFLSGVVVTVRTSTPLRQFPLRSVIIVHKIIYFHRV